MALNPITLIGGTVVCGGVLFFLFCIGLAVWYYFKQPKQEVSATAPEPVVQAAPARAATPEPPAEKAPSADE